MATKFETKYAITRLLKKIYLRSLRLTRVFGVGLLNDGNHILPRPTLVATATNFGSKLAITQLVCEIAPIFLQSIRGCSGTGYSQCQKNPADCVVVKLEFCSVEKVIFAALYLQPLGHPYSVVTN